MTSISSLRTALEEVRSHSSNFELAKAEGLKIALDRSIVTIGGNYELEEASIQDMRARILNRCYETRKAIAYFDAYPNQSVLGTQLTDMARMLSEELSTLESKILWP
jgi:hypothetical protein